MKDSGILDQDLVTKALKANMLDLESVEKVLRQRPQRELSFSLPKPPS